MSKPDNSPLSGPTEVIKSLVAHGEPITLAEHNIFRQLFELSFQGVDPSLVVARRHKIAQQLGSGALKTITLEAVTEEGTAILKTSEPDPPVGRAATRIETERPFVFRGAQIERQHTEVDLIFTAKGAVYPRLDASIPFDDTMKEDTRHEWREWGVELDYGVTDTGGHFAIMLREGFHEIITQALRDLREQ